MSGAIHVVHDEAAVLFDPHVRAAADGAFRRDERQAVGAMRDAVAFPREIVVAFRHITRKRLHDGRRHGGQRRGVQNVISPRFVRREVNLEK